MENPYYRYLKLSMEMYQLNFQSNRTKNEGVLTQSRRKKIFFVTNLSTRELYFKRPDVVITPSLGVSLWFSLAKKKTQLGTIN